jgi:hypothetical protein
MAWAQMVQDLRASRATELAAEHTVAGRRSFGLAKAIRLPTSIIAKLPTLT